MYIFAALKKIAIFAIILFKVWGDFFYMYTKSQKRPCKIKAK